MNDDRNISTLEAFVTFSDPTWCTVVLVGGEYVYQWEAVMQKVDEIGDELERIPKAVITFLKDEKPPENIYSSDNRTTFSPTLVNHSYFVLLIFDSF